MSPDIEDLLRSELRGAASGAPHDLGVADQEVLTRGRRVIVRRRVLTVAGAAAVTLAIAGTIGVLAPRVNNDALPALPTPTLTPTPEATPTLTASASPSATVTASATATQTSTPSATPSSTGTRSRTNSPSSSPPRTQAPTPSTTSSAAGESLGSISFAGIEFSARVLAGVEEGTYDMEIEADGRLIHIARDFHRAKPIGEVAAGNHKILFAFPLGPLSDVVTIDGQPVNGEPNGGFIHNYRTSTGSLIGAEVNIAVLPFAPKVNSAGEVLDVIARFGNPTDVQIGVGN